MSETGAVNDDPKASQEELEEDDGSVEDSHPVKHEEEKGNSEESEKSDGGEIGPEVDGPMMNQNPIPSQVYTATMDTLFSKQKPSHVMAHTLTLDWSFGMNHLRPVFSLQDHDQLVILYAGAHVGVIYSHTANSQHLLQGHCNPISCMCVSEDRRWLVTADKGEESLVIIWDSYSGIPVHTFFDCHTKEGVVALGLSQDTKHLVTLGAGEVQHVCIWDWTNETQEPLCCTELSPKHGFQNYIIFNPNDSTQLLSNSESQVLFYTRNNKSLEHTAPELHDKTFNKVVGFLSQSVFHWKGAQALSATSEGNLVLWDIVRSCSSSRTFTRKAIKLIPLQKDPITVLTLIDSTIVTGDIRGHIKFYDGNIKLLSWYNQFNLDAIISISFSKETTSYTEGYQEDSTLEVKPFVVRNFVVSTVTSTVVHVNAQSAVPKTLLREHYEPLHAVACHPKKPLVAMGSYSGILKMWDYNNKLTISSRVFKAEKQIHYITFDPQGLYLAVGFANGSVQVLDVCTLQSDEKESLKHTEECITHISFSSDSRYLATADAGKAVTAFHLQIKDGSQHWECLGRHYSHYKPIKDLLFGVYLDSTRPRLLSLGMDRRLVEYDLENSDGYHLMILTSERIEQSAVPTCMAWYPPLTTEHFLLTASDHYKMKLFNSTTKMCRKTLCGPTYGSPVEKIVILPTSKESDTSPHYLAYITKDKVGIQILPLDGNPYKSNALICHPTGVSAFACSYDGQFVFTAGGADCTVLSWEINVNVLEAAANLGGKDLIPFYSLLEGGREGEFYREMENFFYYSQLRDQDIDYMEKRQVSTRIPLKEVPFVMRALGFFPTEQELEDIQNEVKFSKYAETGRYVTDIDFDEFIKLYVNHRPVFGISKDDIVKSFQVLADFSVKGEAVLRRDRLLELLQARGEHMTEDEVTKCLSTLLDLSPKKSDPGTDQCDDSEFVMEGAVPDEMTMETFTSHILGFPSCTKESGQ